MDEQRVWERIRLQRLHQLRVTALHDPKRLRLRDENDARHAPVSLEAAPNGFNLRTRCIRPEVDADVTAGGQLSGTRTAARRRDGNERERA